MPNFSYQINEIQTTKNKLRRYQFYKQFRIDHNLSNFNNLYSALIGINKLIEELYDPILKQHNLEDIISSNIYSKSLGYNIFIPPVKIKNFNSEHFINSIDLVIQSNNKFIFDKYLEITIAVTKNISGSGKAPSSKTNRAQRKTSIVEIKGNKACAFKAIAVCKFYIDNKNKPKISKEYIHIKRNVYDLQSKLALDIATQCGLQYNKPVTFNELLCIQNHFKNYQLMVINGNNKKEILFKGTTDAKNKIYIEHYNDHYNSIVNIKGYMGSKYYCDTCHIGYSCKHKHICPTGCKKCYSTTKCEISSSNFEIVCEKCSRDFLNQECYNNHKTNGLCEVIKKCVICERTYKKWINHKCNKYLCLDCSDEYTDQPHRCYIKPKNIMKLMTEDNKFKIMVAFDIESTQEEEFHVPNLLIAKITCPKCWDYQKLDRSEYCDICGEYFQIFWGYDCIKKFNDLIIYKLAEKAENNEGSVLVFAHNSRGYDGHFILKDLWKRDFEKQPTVIFNGKKILKISLANISFIDSLSLFLCPLSQLPKAFNLPNSMKKGVFPHLFNKKKNFEYIGKIPDIEYFEIDYMKVPEAENIKKWHQQCISSNFIFNFKKELIEYCKNDVDILLKSMKVFQKLFSDTTGIDPLTRCFTLASIGLETFKSKFLKENTLAQTPRFSEYRLLKNHSKEGDIWLDWVSKENNIYITREYKIGTKVVDGFDIENDTIYEYFGCYFHACPKCNKNPDKKVDDEKLIAYFKKLNYKLIYIYGCEYKILRLENNFAKTFYNKRYQYYSSLNKVGYANIRESFFWWQNQ